ncbi:hypothetical protein [Ornithinimicrobium pratense]|uniref:DUF998 domain-containing protein n=1 Tax=Ornithinimicrobium pratense TaxID=2593973 RepID=A0A5J6V456_9MICO|nr:hypothetical protein [Ornithinimicrobium pratense]QFG68417.1 hypothetical protein FY030_06545 [Ornithinimicrobium pratense]
MTSRHLLAPTVATGVLMAAYLLLRPYGDAQEDSTAVAEAFASLYWVVAHVCGALALASFALLALRLVDFDDRPATRMARWSGLLGVVLVLPYYGAETFGLHAVGRAALSGNTSALDLVDSIRNQPVALTMLGLGLLLLAGSGIAVALAWQHRPRTPGPVAWAAWPLGLAVALMLPQFYLPPAGRMAFGVTFLLAAVVLAVAVWRSEAPLAASGPEPVRAGCAEVAS